MSKGPGEVPLLVALVRLEVACVLGEGVGWRGAGHEGGARRGQRRVCVCVVCVGNRGSAARSDWRLQSVISCVRGDS